MNLRPLLSLFACLPLAAQVRFSPGPLDVEIDGKPFTALHKGEDANKPYLYPLLSASGKAVTRHFPEQKNVEGETRDHLHHRGLWFTYDDVNGIKFWENDPSYKPPNKGRVVVRKAEGKGGAKSGKLTAAFDWQDPQGKTLLVEDRLMTFYSDPKLRTIDFDITLTPSIPVVFGDTKEGAFAIRLADALTERKGGQMVNAQGAKGMVQVWGKRSEWVDYSGTVDGENLGVAMFDHPSNPRHPTYWHARDYGLFALNPFGRKAFDKDAEESHWSLAAGESLHFRWRVVIHPGNAADAGIANLYKSYAH